MSQNAAPVDSDIPASDGQHYKMNLRVWGKTVERLAVRYPGNNVLVTGVFCLLFVLTAGTDARAAVEKNSDSPNSIAAKFAGEVAGKIHAAARHLEEIGKNEDLRQLFLAGDRAALDAQGEALAPDFKGALKLRLLLPGQYDVELDANPPLGYASLDLLQQAEKSSKPLPAEIHGYGGPPPHRLSSCAAWKMRTKNWLACCTSACHRKSISR